MYTVGARQHYISHIINLEMYTVIDYCRYTVAIIKYKNTGIL